MATSETLALPEYPVERIRKEPAIAPLASIMLPTASEVSQLECPVAGISSIA